MNNRVKFGIALLITTILVLGGLFFNPAGANGDHEKPSTTTTTEVPETPTTTKAHTTTTTVKEFPECPAYYYDGVNSPVYGAPITEDCNGGLYCEPPTVPSGWACITPETPVVTTVPAQVTPAAVVQVKPAFTG